MSGQTFRGTLRQINDLLAEPGPIIQVPVPELVQIGADLWAISTRVKALTEGVKDQLRLLAPVTPGQHLLYGPGASGMVTVQEAQPVLRKEVDPCTLQAALGEDFQDLFEVDVIIRPREGFVEALQRVNLPGRIQIALAAIDLVTPKARVSFQLKGAQNRPAQP